MQTATETAGIKMYKPLGIWVGSTKLPSNHNLLVSDLDFFMKIAGKEFRGILGMASLYKHIWDINFDDKTLTIKQQHYFSLLEDGFKSYEISSTQHGIPFIEVKIAGRYHSFILDTGDQGFGRLTSDMIDSLIEQEMIESVATDTMASISGAAKTRRARVKEIKIGPDSYKGIVMYESSQNALGLGFLNRHHVVLDFINKNIYLKKGSGFLNRDCEDKSGLKLLSHQSKIIVAYVDDRGPAWKAGIRGGYNH